MHSRPYLYEWALQRFIVLYCIVCDTGYWQPEGAEEVAESVGYCTMFACCMCSHIFQQLSVKYNKFVLLLSHHCTIIVWPHEALHPVCSINQSLNQNTFLHAASKSETYYDRNLAFTCNVSKNVQCCIVLLLRSFVTFVHVWMTELNKLNVYLCCLLLHCVFLY